VSLWAFGRKILFISKNFPKKMSANMEISCIIQESGFAAFFPTGGSEIAEQFPSIEQKWLYRICFPAGCSEIA